ERRRLPAVAETAKWIVSCDPLFLAPKLWISLAPWASWSVNGRKVLKFQWLSSFPSGPQAVASRHSPGRSGDRRPEARDMRLNVAIRVETPRIRATYCTSCATCHGGTAHFFQFPAPRSCYVLQGVCYAHGRSEKEKRLCPVAGAFGEDNSLGLNHRLSSHEGGNRGL